LIQNLSCGISPRGIAFTNKKEGLVAGFYSRNIMHIEKDKNKFVVSYFGEPFRYPEHSGNMRHILIDKNNKYAYISNLGLNLLHIYNIEKKEIKKSIVVGINPNTIVFADKEKTKILISCRGNSKSILFDIVTEKIIGTVDSVVPSSTGLCRLDDKNFLTTDFLNNHLIKFKLIGK
jgi:hypothetical protein